MPDLDQLLDTLVADVTAGTRAPGAPTAIKQARRRRAMVAAAGAVAVIALGGGLTVGTLGGSDRVSPIVEPTPPSSESPTVQESAEKPDPSWPNNFGEDLDAILLQAPNWAINHTASPDLSDYDPRVKGPCSGNWSRGVAFVVGDFSKGEVTAFYAEVSRSSRAGIAITGFPSEALASDAAARFVENLDSCTATAWRTQPIAQTGAVLASSADGVAWIQRKGADVEVLQVPTTDGPPPAGVQVEVVEWMAAYRTWVQADSRWPEP